MQFGSRRFRCLEHESVIDPGEDFCKQVCLARSLLAPAFGVPKLVFIAAGAALRARGNFVDDGNYRMVGDSAALCAVIVDDISKAEFFGHDMLPK
jgi:hypothetical protein